VPRTLADVVLPDGTITVVKVVQAAGCVTVVHVALAANSEAAVTEFVALEEGSTDTVVSDGIDCPVSATELEQLSHVTT